MIVTSIQIINNSYYIGTENIILDERPTTFKNKGARTKRFIEDDNRINNPGLPLLMFAVSGSVLFLTHAHHLGITVRQVFSAYNSVQSIYQFLMNLLKLIMIANYSIS
jgi:hypothetical protein